MAGSAGEQDLGGKVSRALVWEPGAASRGELGGLLAGSGVTGTFYSLSLFCSITRIRRVLA